MKPNLLICAFARHDLFQGSGFLLGPGIDAAEIEEHGGKILHSESCDQDCQNMYVVEDRISTGFAQLRQAQSRHYKFRTPRWLRDCFTVQSTVLPPEIAAWRGLLHSPWPITAMAPPPCRSRPLCIAITGPPTLLTLPCLPLAVMRIWAGDWAGYSGTPRDTLQELVVRTGAQLTKTLCRSATHLIYLSRRSRPPMISPSPSPSVSIDLPLPLPPSPCPDEGHAATRRGREAGGGGGARLASQEVL
jgi:hypothetical protein